MSITPMPPAVGQGGRFEHRSVLGGKPCANRFSFQWKSTPASFMPPSPDETEHTSHTWRWTSYHRSDSPFLLRCLLKRSSRELHALQTRQSAWAREPTTLIFHTSLCRHTTTHAKSSKLPKRVRHSRTSHNVTVDLSASTQSDLRMPQTHMVVQGRHVDVGGFGHVVVVCRRNVEATGERQQNGRFAMTLANILDDEDSRRARVGDAGDDPLSGSAPPVETPMTTSAFMHTLPTAYAAVNRDA